MLLIRLKFLVLKKDDKTSFTQRLLNIKLNLSKFNNLIKRDMFTQVNHMSLHLSLYLTND